MRRFKKKWMRPKKAFDKVRINYENILKKNYGFRRKKEIWKLEYYFKNIKRRARKILAEKNKEDEKILINKLVKLGVANKDFTLDDVLNLDLEAFCERRLQTIVYKKNIANTIKHARQLIAHKKIIIEDRTINQPNYLVRKDEEDKIKLKEKIDKTKSEENEKTPKEETGKENNKEDDVKEKEEPKVDKE